MKRVHYCLLFLAWLSLGGGFTSATAKPGFYHHPDLHGDRIVFTAEDDLWITSDRGEGTRRLTSHPGNETYARFSPDGTSIAFTGEYDGNADAFLVSVAGGEPKRLTWHPGPDQVITWTPDGSHIIFRSYAAEPNTTWELYRVPAAGGDPEKLPLGWSSRIDIDSQTGMWAFNRESRETATWKRYRGGTAPDIWVGDPDRMDFKQVTSFPGMNAFPMWHGGRIFYLSDQGGTANLWSMKPDGSDSRRLTDLGIWDARWPAMGSDGRIVFSAGADLHLFDAADGSVRKVEIDLPSDRTLTRTRYPEASKYLTSFSLSPDGERLAVTARGEVFSVAVKDGVTLPVTHGSGARERSATFTGDGKQIAYVSDAPREEEIRTIDAWGRGEPRTVKPAGDTGWHLPPACSPDGAWIAYGDQTNALYVVPAKGGSPKLVDRGPQNEIREYTWSPDGRWLAYTKTEGNDYGSIHIFDTKSTKVTPVTGSTTDDFSPAWDPDGRYLYFLSNRATNPFLGTQDWQNVELKATKLFMVLLRKDVKHPFTKLNGLPPGPEDATKSKADSKDDKEKEDADKAPKPVEIDLDGLGGRLVHVPVDRGRYYGLGATAETVFYLSAPLKGFAEQAAMFGESEPENTLMAFDLEKKKSKPFMEGVSGYDLAPMKDKLAVMKEKGEIYVLDTGTPPAAESLAESKVSLATMTIDLDPREEWEQIYFEGWRHMRDFYWDAGMGGLNWKLIRDQYAELLPRLSTRGDLEDLMGEVIGELSTSHTYIWGGDPGKSVSHVSTGLLGADVVRDGDAYRVVRIYRGDPADNVRSPLEEPGVNVSEGEFLIAVNHIPFAADQPFLAAFENLAGKDVVLTVGDRASGGTRRDVVVTTMTGEGDLRYSDWVRRNREYVAEKTGGKIAYIHVPDMWADGLIEFDTWFYPQLEREGMVVDIRWNGGGAVSQQLVERFRRKVVSFDRARSGGVSTYPLRVLNGPFVVLTNEFAGSDGDIFPHVIQLEKLAPVIGMRSWGGVVGIRGDKTMVDGGMLTQPEFAWWDPAKGWDLENWGVDPDIEVQNLPQDLARGKDPQLDRGIEEVMKLHQSHPPLIPEWGPVKDRSRAGYGGREPVR